MINRRASVRSGEYGTSETSELNRPVRMKAVAQQAFKSLINMEEGSDVRTHDLIY